MLERLPRAARLQSAIDVAEELAPLDGQTVRAWFDKYEAKLCRDMIEADPTDDTKRRDAALRAWALRDLRTFIRNTIEEGRRAPKEISRIK